MTIEQRKLELINWISTLEDENLIHEIEVFRSTTLIDLPDKIIELLTISDSKM